MPDYSLTILGGITAAEAARLLEAADSYHTARRRWQRWLSGEHAFPVAELDRLARAVDAGPRAIADAVAEIGERVRAREGR